jgi:hypothetical protein
MKSITLTFLLAFTTLLAYNQDEVKFEPVEDDPAFNGITIAPFMGVNYSFGQTFSTNVGMELMVRKLPVHFRAYIDQTLISAALFTDGYSSPRIIEGGVSYPFIKSSKTKSKKINLNVSEGSEYVHTTFIKVPTTIEKFTTARAGLFRNKGNYKQTITFAGQPNPYDVAADYKTSGLYLGVSQNWRNNTVIDAEGYGERRNTGFTQLYADLLLGLVRDFGTFESPFTNFPGSHPITESQVSYSNVGMRVGIITQLDNYDAKRPNAIGAKFEFGARPAPTGERFWMNIQAYYLFNVK